MTAIEYLEMHAYHLTTVLVSHIVVAGSAMGYSSKKKGTFLAAYGANRRSFEEKQHDHGISCTSSQTYYLRLSLRVIHYFVINYPLLLALA